MKREMQTTDGSASGPGLGAAAKDRPTGTYVVHQSTDAAGEGTKRRDDGRYTRAREATKVNEAASARRRAHPNGEQTNAHVDSSPTLCCMTEPALFAAVERCWESLFALST